MNRDLKPANLLLIIVLGATKNEYAKKISPKNHKCSKFQNFRSHWHWHAQKITRTVSTTSILLECAKNVTFLKSVNKHMSFLKVLLEMLKKNSVFLTFWDKTGVPDDAKMSQEEEPEDLEENKNKEMKKQKMKKREK